jgi:mono/diheme cytochrome c family protein
MKKVITISVLILGVTIAMISCSNKRSPGSVYMPDMGKSRTYESYDLQDSSVFTSNMFGKGGNKIFFNAMPAAGTIKRGELFPYTLLNDSNGYKMSAAVPNPIDFMTGAELSEAGRLYNINCGICHGEKATGNGPLAEKIGAVANLTLDLYKAMADGTMFHSITYGKNNMGSYASQLSREQRWKVIKYVRTLQGGGATGAAATTDTTKTATPAATTGKTATDTATKK